MDEYITRNNAISAVCFGCNQEFSDEPCEPSECAIRQSIMAVPTADVVPKSEVEEISGKYEDLKLKYADLQKDKDELITWGNDKKTEVAREIFEEIEKIIDNNTYKSYLPNSSLWCKEYKSNQIIVEITELKKKYTEGL